ncbi:hypothetical protein DCAR_0414971 [Daucus carota subsp. sativus]|uniref:Uncharacterized protein n=1 Tax=Daucus carota subsp. sativus TaxID=79200 RepID=A0A165A4H5_DAUCS|nr:hypothetical protein DCAR_0414971 [Daucus carota subsp. sativus]
MLRRWKGQLQLLLGLYMFLVYASDDVGYTANSAGQPLPLRKKPTQCNDVY